MENKTVRDMTKGSITGHLIGFTLPLLFGNVFQQFYNLADSIIVGQHLGKYALGAVGSVGSLVFLFFSLCLGLSSGIGILVAQSFGAGREKDVKDTIGQAVYVTIVSGILMSLVGALLAEPILNLKGTPQENFSYALTYMRIVCGFTFINAVYNAISAILRSLGDSKTPLIFLVVASVVNVGLDYLFVVVFEWGVAGAAIATVIAQFVSAVGSIICAVIINPYLKLTRENMKVKPDLILKEVKMGIPLAAQASTIAVSCAILQRVVNNFGPTVMAAYTASMRVEQIVQQPYQSLSIAMSTFGGQNFGAGRNDRVKMAARRGTIIITCFSALMILVMYTLGNNIVGAFVDDEMVINIGAQGLKFTSLMYIFLGLIYVMRGLLNGVGDVKFAFINGMIEVFCRIGFALGLIYIFKMDYMASWYTNGLTWSITGIISVLRFYFGKWRFSHPTWEDKNNMEIRKSTEQDIDRILEIYAIARNFMAEHDNPNQWGPTSWPQEDVIRRDISQQKSYVCLNNKGEVIGTFFYDCGEDIEETYRTIEEGQWADNGKFGVVHRLASDGSEKGVGKYCIDWAFSQCGHLKIDTHEDNYVMQNLLGKLGFEKRGIIHVLQDNYPRYAYEKN